jgi:hypothetical protein
MKKIIVIILNVFALYLMSTNDKDSIIVGMIIFLTSYLYLFLYFILSNNSRNYTLAQPILNSEASLPQPKFKVEKITSYKVDEELLTKEKWKEIKIKLNSFAIEFLKKNFPGVEWNSKILLAEYNNYSAGSFLNMTPNQKILFEERNATQILISEPFLYAMVKFNDFGIVQPIFEHELVHYALWYQNKNFNDGDSDFEKKIAELNIRSNNAGVVKIYSLGIDRNKIENGIEDTLNLIIPPSKSDEENKQALELYKKKYDSKETA